MKKITPPSISLRVIDFENSAFTYQGMNDVPKRVPVMIHRPNSYKVSPNDEDACALAEITLERTGLYAKLVVFSEKKKLFEDLMIRSYVLTPYGYGLTGKKIREYNLICLYLEKNEHNTGPTDGKAKA